MYNRDLRKIRERIHYAIDLSLFHIDFFEAAKFRFWMAALDLHPHNQRVGRFMAGGMTYWQAEEQVRSEDGDSPLLDILFGDMVNSYLNKDYQPLPCPLSKSSRRAFAASRKFRAHRCERAYSCSGTRPSPSRWRP
jgi:hypothetical protein